MSITTIAQAEAALQPYVPLVAQLTGKDTTLERIQPLMAMLGNPQNKTRIIHVAGTSGKTSTCYYLAAMLKASGKKVGLTVSPHVDSITERVQINGQPISESEFCQLLEEFLELIKDAEQPPSYFELLYAFALWVFDRHAVDYAVIETGMGGLHDATNVASRADKACVITDIGFDHMHVLGNTLPEIAAQKIGIVHTANPVLMYRQSDEIMQVIEAYVKAKHATLITTTEDYLRSQQSLLLDDLPEYQQRNWLLAKYVYDYVANRDKLDNLTSKLLQETLLIQVPARMDIQTWHNKTIVMDGAHNQQKMSAFIGSFQRQFPGTKPAILIALKQGKEYQQVAPLLAGLGSRIIITTFDTSQDLPAVSMNITLLADAFRAANPSLVIHTIADQQLALEALLQSPEEVCIITGSFYLLSQIRRQSA